MNYTFPFIVSATDIRYKFKSIAEKVTRTGTPAVVVDNSKPLVVIYPHVESTPYSLQIKRDKDEIYETRKKVAKYVKGVDSVEAVRKTRQIRWNLS